MQELGRKPLHPPMGRCAYPRPWPDSNRRWRLCRPLPMPLGHRTMEAAGVASGEDAGAPSDHPKVYRSTSSDSYQI